MAQHFLHSPAAKILSITAVMRMTEEEARTILAQIRWSATEGAPVCPVCGSLDHYTLKTRPVWKCKACKKQFSVTSGTIFASRKMPGRDILAGIAIFVNGAKGFSALQLSRDLRVDYKTAFEMLHKLREAIGLAREAAQLDGVVEIDGMYVGSCMKPANRREAWAGPPLHKDPVADKRPLGFQAIGGRLNVETADARGAFVGPDPLPG
jgi:transposase-like protein